jgi:hypothetical protein
MSGFIIIRLFADIQANTVLFLLLSGYAANYVNAGLAKLRINPIYYVMNNNPVNLFMNAYKMGWNSFISEGSVLKIRKYSDKYRALINILVLLIEIGMIFIFLSHYVAVFFALLGFVLHLLIFVHDGDCFWKWMLVDLSVAASLFVAGSSTTIFTNNRWLVSSFVFILLANGWMNAKELGWLDSPYVEYFKFEGYITEKDQWVPINPNIFRPFDFILTQGVTGTLNFLTDEESLTYSYGNISLNGRTVDAHKQIVNLSNKKSVDPHEVKSVVRKFGTSEYKTGSKEKMSELIKSRFDSDDTSIGNRTFRLISSPREFYSAGLSDSDSYKRASDFEKVRLRRVAGIWTDDGFRQVDEQQMLSVNVSNNHNQPSDQD